MSEIRLNDQIQILMIPIDQIDVNEWNPNELSDEMFNRLAEDVQSIGFLQPILVIKKEDGRFLIIDGEHRYTAAMLMDMAEIPCIVSESLADDEDLQKFQTMRMNQIRGSLNRKKFQAMVEDLAKRHSISEIAEGMAFDDEDYLQSMISDARASLPPEMKGEFDKAKEEIKTVDDLSLVLNRLFTKYGSTLPCNFMIMDFGGKEHLWVRFKDRHVYDLAKEKASLCLSNKVTFSSLVERLLLQADDDFMDENREFLEPAKEE